MTTTTPLGPSARRTGSHTSLTHLTLAPLSTGRPLIDAEDDNTVDPYSQRSSHSYASSPLRHGFSTNIGDEDVVSPAPTAPFQYHHSRYLSRPSSYIAARSVPTTPGILSRSQSPNRGAPKSAGRDLGGSKSFTHLPLGELRPAGTSGATTPDLSVGGLDVGAAVARQTKRQRDRARFRQNRESSEWLYRHGIALADSARDSKGQSWLVNRASSTSLAAVSDEKRSDRLGERSPELGRKSARHSRRGSRANLSGLAMTSTMSTTSAGTPFTGIWEGRDYFSHKGEVRGVEGPDFVNVFEEDAEDDVEVFEGNENVLEEQERHLDDAEIALLARRSTNGFGIGGVMDRLVSWSLFDAGSREQNKQEEEEDEMRAEQQSRLKRVRDSQAELAKLANAEQMRMSKEKGKQKENEKSSAENTGSGWGDAAWLLSVASKVIF